MQGKGRVVNVQPENVRGGQAGDHGHVQIQFFDSFHGENLPSVILLEIFYHGKHKIASVLGESRKNGFA